MIQLWENGNITHIQLRMVISRLYDQYFQQWFSVLRTTQRLETYGLIKNNFELEKYLMCVKNDRHKLSLTKFRCSAHRLMIEEGRHLNIEKQDRLCNKCNMHAIENEYHFLLVCPFYRKTRADILPRYYCHWPTLHKFKTLLTCPQSSVIIKLAKFIYVATLLRGE